MTRILVFGDSIAWGAHDLERGGWVDRLKVFFHTTGSMNEVFNLCNSGTESKDLLRTIKNESKARISPEHKDREIIIIAIGINDSRLIAGKIATPKPKFEANIKKLIAIAKKAADKVVLVGLTPVEEPQRPDWDPCEIFKNELIKKYDGIIKSVCSEAKVYFIDLYNALEKLGFTRLLVDGLHPNAKGHELLYKLIREFLEKNQLI